VANQDKASLEVKEVSSVPYFGKSKKFTFQTAKYNLYLSP
jgi:hypothetical protein